ncbi:MAG: SRPBCC family protein [Lentisphaerales bacterium]|nr:SRPBCC family protein [Lentisphaerales bacterium]
MIPYKLHRVIDLPISKEKCWDFFSDPKNLKVITPDYMGFDIVEGGNCRMYQGQIIGYKVSPLIGVKVSWVTEITHVRENEFFVDEQRFGPYKFWHHKHFFKEIRGGMRCVDEIHYLPPVSLFAPLLNALIIKSKLKEIFDYRSEKLESLFGLIKNAD